MTEMTHSSKQVTEHPLFALLKLFTKLSDDELSLQVRFSLGEDEHLKHLVFRAGIFLKDPSTGGNAEFKGFYKYSAAIVGEASHAMLEKLKLDALDSFVLTLVGTGQHHMREELLSGGLDIWTFRDEHYRHAHVETIYCVG